MGDPDARDLLISPAVLMREAKPEEDCDGFAMGGCTLLQILGVRCYIVTVKSDPARPWRWSHVFVLADLGNGALSPFDASGPGLYPGWMVPPAHMFAYQVWDLNGSPIDLPVPVGRSLGLSGLGDDGDLADAVDQGLIDTSVPTYPTVTFPTITPNPSDVAAVQASLNAETAALSAPIQTITLPSGITAPAAGGIATSPGINWTSILGTAITDASNDAKLAAAPAGSILTASGALITPGATSAAAISSALPLLLIGGGLLLAFSIFKGSK